MVTTRAALPRVDKSPPHTGQTLASFDTTKNVAASNLFSFVICYDNHQIFTMTIVLSWQIMSNNNERVHALVIDGA
jgi:hypothetical protein